MSAVKLFGKTIGLPPETVEAAEICESTEAAKEISSNPNPERQSQLGKKQDESKEPNAPDNSKVEPTELDDKPTLKKPDTILPCPRCNSMETKFCYFNNYNVNQPRHFCRKCQRYWTAGGTMRNVPVGAGRRKNKNILAASSQVRPLTVPVNHPNGTVLVFNSDLGAPLCDSMVSVLSGVDKVVRSGEMDGDDCSSLSSDSSSKDEVSVFREGAWPYPCQNTAIQWTSPTSPPTFAPAIIPLQYYSTTPPPYWASPTVCNVPFVINPPVPSSPTLGKHARDENIPKTPESSCNNDNLEKSLWVPKTLRVDDSREAAKSSSVWATLGINNDITKNDDCGGVSVSVGVGSRFKAFQSQTEVEQKNEFQETSAALQANPAALSRSVSFRENS